MVRQGCLALAIAMPRVNLSMIVPFGGGCDWVSLAASTRTTETSGQAEVAHLLQQPVQGGLVGDVAAG